MYVIECSNFVIMYDCMAVRKKKRKKINPSMYWGQNLKKISDSSQNKL